MLMQRQSTRRGLKNYVKAAETKKFYYATFLVKSWKTALALGKKRGYFTDIKDIMMRLQRLLQLMF
jgi:hypothetical protein